MAKKNSNKTIWLLAALVSVAMVLYWLAPGGEKPRSPQQPQAQTQEKFKTEKSGATTAADFTETAWKVHSLVDEAFVTGKAKIKAQQEQKREVPRQGVEGTIRWHARQTLITIPAGSSTDKFKDLMVKTLSQTGQVLGSAPDQYQGANVLRFDVGFRDRLEGDPVTMITDRIYVAKEQAVPERKSQAAGGESGKLAIVLDDFGYNYDPIDALAAIDRPLTFAILPYHPFSQIAASKALASNHQVMLHLPMEPMSTTEQQEKTAITVGMSDSEIQQIVTSALQNIPGLIGVNNHQGSKATADKRVMRNVLTVLKTKNLFFIDSRTNGQSVAAQTAREMNIPTSENELFLDNNNDVEAIKQQLRTAGHIALRDGTALVIGHARPNTAIALREMIPELEADGVRLIFASDLVK
ncbi:divergent polysaccharide deacetylase family protein [Anaerospora sp.]|uniref:divergent polysaccharide deacetylase family protein n=1 Tax=Anaerospora sp. TaxID=1960278 RepID=UPI00289BDE41|nr:divergent polysaccharide deacetylase family protein [Anaerospora sp.]